MNFILYTITPIVVALATCAVLGAVWMAWQPNHEADSTPSVLSPQPSELTSWSPLHCDLCSEQIGCAPADTRAVCNNCALTTLREAQEQVSGSQLVAGLGSQSLSARALGRQVGRDVPSAPSPLLPGLCGSHFASVQKKPWTSPRLHTL